MLDFLNIFKDNVKREKVDKYLFENFEKLVSNNILNLKVNENNYEGLKDYFYELLIKIDQNELDFIDIINNSDFENLQKDRYFFEIFFKEKKLCSNFFTSDDNQKIELSVRKLRFLEVSKVFSFYLFLNDVTLYKKILSSKKATIKFIEFFETLLPFFNEIGILKLIDNIKLSFEKISKNADEKITNNFVDYIYKIIENKNIIAKKKSLK